MGGEDKRRSAMADFNTDLRGFLNQLNRAFPDYRPLRRLRNDAKRMMANSPESPAASFASFFEGDQEALIALRNGDVDALLSQERVVGCALGALAAKLWGGMSAGSREASRRHLLAMAAAAGLDEGTDPGLANGARAWSAVFSEVLGKRVLVPSAFLGKMERVVELLRDLIDAMEDDDLPPEELEEMLDGVDLDLGAIEERGGDEGERRGQGLSEALGKLLPRFKEVMLMERAGGRMESAEVAEYVLAKLKDERCVKAVASLRSAFSNVQSRHLQSALAKLAGAVDVSSVESAVASVRAIDPRDFEEEMSGMAKGLDASKLQAVARSLGKLLETSGVAGALGVDDVSEKLDGMFGGREGSERGVVSTLMSSEAAPGMISQIPAAIGEDGSLDLGRAAAMAMRSRRVPKRPRVTGKR